MFAFSLEDGLTLGFDLLGGSEISEGRNFGCRMGDV